MRPKKVILCVHSDELALSVGKFFLETHGYRVVCATDAPEACELLKAEFFDALIVDASVDQAFELVTWLRLCNTDTSSILTSDTIKPGEVAHSADWFLAKGFGNWQLLEAVKIGVSRKRGPRKQAVVIQEAVA